MLSKRGLWQGEVQLLLSLSGGALHLENPHASDLERIAQLVSACRDLPLGTTDASIVAAAERLKITTLATLDRRHLSVVRPRHAEAFELLP